MPAGGVPGAPDFFIVGHPKCGTTALYEMLRRHPEVFMPELKETRFFARELHPGSPRPGVLPESLEEYLALFGEASPGQRTGEASPSYLRSQRAAARIAEVSPGARIVALLREPADFVRSLHLELVRDHVEPEPDLRKALALESVRREAGQRERRPGLVYSDYVHYVDQLRRYEDVFPAEQMKVLIYDDFRADNEGTVQSVLRFLGVGDAPPLEIVEANPSIRVRSPRADELVRTLYLGRGSTARGLKRAIKALTPRRARRGALGLLQRRVLYGSPSVLDEQLVGELRRRFRGEVVALSEHLQRDLVGLWGYDRLD